MVARPEVADHRRPVKAFARVFALAPDCHAGDGRYPWLWRRHFYQGLRGALPSVLLPAAVDFGWARPAAQVTLGPSPQRTTISERLWDQIRAARDDGGLDAVISYCFSTDVDPGLVARTVEAGVPWINFFCDSSYAFDRVEALARTASLNWFPEHAAIARYRALGRPLLCRPYALHAAALPQAACEKAEYAVGFVGAPTGNRVLRLAGLHLAGCRVAVRGEGWRRAPATAAPLPSRRAPADRRARGHLAERMLVRALRPVVCADGGGPLADGQLAPFLSRCRTVLGLNEGRDRQGAYRSYLKLRDVEFPGYGCCYLTQDNEDVRRAFEVGREVLTFRGALEAAGLVRRIAREPALARAIGQAGRRRVLGEHTWTTRLGELARAL
jgi:spore maturation protein CgeB